MPTNHETSRATETLQQTRPGPWGKIEYFPIYLDPPESCFAAKSRETATEWIFPDHDIHGVETFFETMEIGLDQISGPGTIVAATNGIIVRPNEDFLWSMSAELRQKLYPRLIDIGGTKSRINEFVIDRACFRENAAGLDIPEKIIDFVESRSFLVGRKCIFAETRFALSQVDDPATRIRILIALARARSLVARLQLNENTDLKSVADWWTAGPNRSRALPMLEAAMEMRGVDSLDLIHLLPPVPRRLLNTFPEELDTLHGKSPDCYWAAMNFFSETASSRFLDSEIPKQYYFLKDFEQVQAPWQFGDVGVLINASRTKFVHAFVYIADDIVFTKNGSGRFFPFVLMKKEDMLDHYVSSEDMIIDIYRYQPLN